MVPIHYHCYIEELEEDNYHEWSAKGSGNYFPEESLPLRNYSN